MAQVTITIPDTHVPRVLAALGAANATEAKARIIDYIKLTVVQYENGLLRDAQEAQTLADIAADPIT